MPDNDNKDALKRLEVQEDASKVQQATLEGIEALLTQLLRNQPGWNRDRHFIADNRHEVNDNIHANSERKEETIVSVLRLTTRFWKTVRLKFTPTRTQFPYLEDILIDK